MSYLITDLSFYNTTSSVCGYCAIPQRRRKINLRYWSSEAAPACPKLFIYFLRHLCPLFGIAVLHPAHIFERRSALIFPKQSRVVVFNVCIPPRDRVIKKLTGFMCRYASPLYKKS